MEISLEKGLCGSFVNGQLSAGIASNGVTPWSTSALWLGDSNVGNGWERFLPVHARLTDGKFFQGSASEKNGKSFIDSPSEESLLLLVHTGSRQIKATKVAHGVFCERGMAEKIDGGTLGRKPNIRSFEELWELNVGSAVLILTAHGSMIRVENVDGALTASVAREVDFHDPIMTNILDEIIKSVTWANENDNRKVFDGAMHQAITEAMNRSDWFSSENRKRFRDLINGNELSHSLQKRVDQLSYFFPDGRFTTDSSVVRLDDHRKGPPADRKKVLADRSAEARQKTAAQKGLSPSVPAASKGKKAAGKKK